MKLFWSQCLVWQNKEFQHCNYLSANSTKHGQTPVISTLIVSCCNR